MIVYFSTTQELTRFLKRRLYMPVSRMCDLKPPARVQCAVLQLPSTLDNEYFFKNQFRFYQTIGDICTKQ